MRGVKLLRILFGCAAVLLSAVTAQAYEGNLSYAIGHYILGIMHEDAGDLDTAIREYKRALKADRKSVTIRLHLAVVYIRKNRPARAIPELKAASALDPEAVEPQLLLALLYAAQNKIDLATTSYEKALKNAAKSQPQNTAIRKSLGIIYIQQKRFRDAEALYRLQADLDTKDAESRYYLATVYSELKDDAAAERELNEALTINPDFHEALNFLGYMYVEQNRDLDKAETMILKALEFEPDNGAYIDSLGWLYFKRGKLREAVAKLEQAASLLEDPVIYDHLGDAYHTIGADDKAKFYWRKSLSLDPRQDAVKKKLEGITTSPGQRSVTP